MKDNTKQNVNEELDELTVIDATGEHHGVNVIDATLDDDDYTEDDLYDGYSDEKISEPHTEAVRSVVFGSLSIILPLLAWLISMINSLSFVALGVAVIAVAFAVVGLVSAMKCQMTPKGSLSEGMANVGRLVSIIGLAISSLILIIVFLNLIISLLILIAFLVIYTGILIVSLVLFIIETFFSAM